MKLSPIIALLVLGTAASQAAVIAYYDIPASGATLATTKDPLVTANPITSGAGQFTVSTSSGTAFLLFVNSGADLASSISGADYLQFTVSVTGSNTLSLDNLSISFKTEDATVSANLSVFASLNNFATAPTVGTELGTITSSSTSYGSQSISLTGPAYQNLTNSTVTFRIYGFDVDSVDASKYIRIDNFTLNGTAVPEPSIALLSLGVAPFLMRRRRA